MFDIDDYLHRIGYTGPRDVSAGTLRELHRRHLCAIPFDNGAALREGVNADADDYSAVVMGGRGGMCLELNNLFRRLLDGLGFDTIVLSAGVRQASGGYSHDLAHVFTGVRLAGRLWLADVGFQGPSYIEPVLVDGGVVEQAGCQYQVSRLDDYLVLRRKPANGDWKPVYRFRPEHRDLREYAHRTEEFARRAAESVIGSTRVCSRATGTGYRVLFGRFLVEVDNGVETSRPLVDEQEFTQVRASILRTGEAVR